MLTLRSKRDTVEANIPYSASREFYTVRAKRFPTILAKNTIGKIAYSTGKQLLTVGRRNRSLFVCKLAYRVSVKLLTVRSKNPQSMGGKFCYSTYEIWQ